MASAFTDHLDRYSRLDQGSAPSMAHVMYSVASKDLRILQNAFEQTDGPRQLGVAFVARKHELVAFERQHFADHRLCSV